MVMWGSRDPILEFWDPLISRERLKLETSNLARRRTAVNSNEKKMKIGSERVMWGWPDQILEFWDSPNISRTVEARNFKFGTQRTSVSSNENKNLKVGKKGHVEVTWPNFGILGPPLYLANGWSYKLQIWHGDGRRWVRTKKIQNWVKRGHVGVTWPNFVILGPL